MEVNTQATIIVNMVVQLLLVVFVFYILYRVGWKPFLTYLTERQTIVTTILTEAQTQKEDANTLFVEAQEKLLDINAKTDGILHDAEQTAKIMVEQQTQKLKKELERKRLAADAQLAADRTRLQDEMQKQAVDMATKVAGQFLSANATEEQTEKQIESFIEKMGDK
ncbi:MAG: hypothetical protein ACRC6X_00695 [Culicoidibacterales bacterium]